MKGHVGGGPVSRGLWARGMIGQIYAVPNVLIRKHTSLYICAGTAPRDAGLLRPIPPELVGHQLESLILAQNERWRHA